MGNTSSSGGRGHHDESVDYGSLVPQGVYTGPRDWNHAIVSQLIIARKLAPFYRPLEDYEESWDDDQLLAARKELNPRPENSEQPSRSDSNPSLSSKPGSKRSVPNREQAKPEAAVYRGAVECPICFLYYPSNINRSRCCDQAICTECFVQIKRNEPTTTHLVSEPAACPFCVQDNFGIVYRPPPWRAGMGSDASVSSWPEQPKEPTQPPTHRRRQKSYSADSPEVVTTDQIRPDWEAKLAAVRAAVARRANRRIVMRQVGDRLIPVGVTSGRIHALNPEEVTEAEGGGSRRRRRHGGNSQLEQFMSIPGQDLEELMLMEAMRLSLIEHEEQQRKEAEEKRKRGEEEAAAAAAAGPLPETDTSNGSGPQTIPGTGSSTPATPPRNLSAPSSSEASSAQLSSFQQSRGPSDSGPQHSRSNSRSRASALASDPESSNGEPSNSRNQQAANPPPFSALNAALASASTASAILSNSRPSVNQESHPPISPRNPFLALVQKEEQARNSAQHDFSNFTQITAMSPNDTPQHNHERPPVPPKVGTPSPPPTSRDRSDHGLNDQLSSEGQLASASDSDGHEPFSSSQKRKSRLGAESEQDCKDRVSRDYGQTVTSPPDG